MRVTYGARMPVTPPTARMVLTRRTFIRAGALGAGALAAAGVYEAWRVRHCAQEGRMALKPAGRDLFAAIIPAILDGVVAPDAWTPARLGGMLDEVERTVASLAPAAREELGQLTCLLDQAPLRGLLAGVWGPWSGVDAERARRLLTGWRASRSRTLVSAYQALHDITFATWYGQPGSWSAIGYPGPPRLGTGDA